MAFEIKNRRYTGSKLKLISWIRDHLKNKYQSSFIDIFAGTGVVAASVLDSFDKVIINDFLYSNFIIYKAFLGNGKFNHDKISGYIEEFNDRTYTKKENYFSKSFGGKYFSVMDAMKIGFIRQDLEDNKDQFTDKEYAILLSSLIYSTDKIANTVGHYDAYRKKILLADKFSFKIILPIKHNKKIEIYQKDANLLIKSLSADVLYIDPPYNSRQYSRFYHVLENLASWKKPKLFGTAKKPEPDPSTTSSYCKVKAYDMLKDLIESANVRTIVLSYNNTYASKSSSSRNKITLDQVESIMRSKGKTKIIEKSFSSFNAGKTNFDDHKEFLFITQV
jgi:adenine-specific DNA-methyltransferase